MRVKLHCQLTSAENIISYNYNHAVSSFIYRLLAKHDLTYSKELHESKDIKNFTFSPLEFQKADFSKVITIQGRRFSLIVSSSRDKLIEALLNYDGQEYPLNTKAGSIRFKVEDVELSKPVIDGNIFQLASPLAINIKKDNKEYFLAPHEEGYSTLLFKNLIRKAGKQESDYDIADFGFEVLSKKPKSKFVNHVKGYLYAFRIDCPVELIRAGVLDGFGIKNSQGFGLVK